MPISKVIPNPFDKDSSLADLTKKVELIREGLGFTTIIKNIIFLIVLVFLLVKFLQIPINITLILIGAHMLTTFVAGYLKIIKLKAMYNIETTNNARSYRNILVTNEYYDLIKSIFGVISSIISLGLIFLFFQNEISNFVLSNIPLITLKSVSLKYFIFIFLVFNLFGFFMKFVRYSWIKNLKESDNFAEVDQDYVIIGKKLELIKFIPAMFIILIILYFIENLIFRLFFGGFMLLILILSIIELKRIKQVRFNEREDNKSIEIDKSTVQHKIISYKNEQIVFPIFGIIKTAASFKDKFKLHGFSMLGAGKRYYPENTLFITNHRLLFVQVPVTGGNKIIGSKDYVSENFFYNRSEIRKKGEEMLKTMTISQILPYAMNDFLYSDIKKIILKWNTQIIIEKINGEKYSCAFLDKEYAKPLKKILSSYLKEKFMEK